MRVDNISLRNDNGLGRLTDFTSDMHAAIEQRVEQRNRRWITNYNRTAYHVARLFVVTAQCTACSLYRRSRQGLTDLYG